MATRPDNAARNIARNWKHGHAVRGRVTPEYKTWRSMIVRCEDPTNVSFKYYGARGITVCERWQDFQTFLADMGPRPKGKTLDRIDANGNYEPGNVRWVTPSDQRKNQRLQDDRARVLAGWATRRARGWKPKRDDKGRFA